MNIRGKAISGTSPMMLLIVVCFATVFVAGTILALSFDLGTQTVGDRVTLSVSDPSTVNMPADAPERVYYQSASELNTEYDMRITYLSNDYAGDLWLKFTVTAYNIGVEDVVVKTYSGSAWVTTDILDAQAVGNDLSFVYHVGTITADASGDVEFVIEYTQAGTYAWSVTPQSTQTG